MSANALIKQRLCQFVSEHYNNFLLEPISELQPASFCFHNNHGTHIVLSDNKRTSEKTIGKGTAGWGNGIVMSRDHMQVNHLYEVSFQRKERN